MHERFDPPSSFYAEDHEIRFEHFRDAAVPLRSHKVPLSVPFSLRMYPRMRRTRVTQHCKTCLKPFTHLNKDSLLHRA